MQENPGAKSETISSVLSLGVIQTKLKGYQINLAKIIWGLPYKKDIERVTNIYTGNYRVTKIYNGN